MKVDDFDWRVRLQMAGEHLARVEAGVAGFLATKPYALVSTRENDSGVVADLRGPSLGVIVTGIRPQRFRGLRTYDLVFKVETRAHPPARLAHEIGDTIENLRSSLEILMFALAEQHSGQLTESQERSVAFPVKDNAMSFAKSGRANIRFAEPAVQAVVESLQPYVGVSAAEISAMAPALPEKIDRHPLLMLDRMRQQNYHRKPLLAATAGGVDGIGFSPAPGMTVTLNPDAEAGRPAWNPDAGEVYRLRITQRRPGELNYETRVDYDVTFAPEGPGRGLPVLVALVLIRDHIRDVVFPALEPFVKV